MIHITPNTKIVRIRLKQPLFLAKDVAEWIEHSKVSMMLQSIDEDEKVKVNNVYSESRRGGNGTWFLTEDGLYEVLMQSRKPIAKKFKKEVKNILKQIRMTGGYIPVIYGGFGPEQKVIADNTISEIHGIRMDKVNANDDSGATTSSIFKSFHTFLIYLL